MSNTNFINETTICKYDSGNKSKSDFHSVTIRFRRGLGGIHNSEIKLVEDQAKKDFENEVILAYTIGIEGEGEDRHLHVSMVLATKTESHVTQQRYEQLIEEERLEIATYTRDTKDGPKKVKSCVTVKVTQPKKNVIANIRAFTWLSYPLKEMAKEFNDIAAFKADVTDEHFAATFEEFPEKQFLSVGLFDQGSESISKDEFLNSIFTTWQKKLNDKSGKIQSLSLGSNILTEQVRVFLKDRNIELEWLVESDNEATAKNQATILTKMVLNKLGKTRYVLAKTFFSGSKIANIKQIGTKLGLMKPADDRTSAAYETALYEAIETRVCEAWAIPTQSKADKKLLKANEKLVKENQKLKQKFDSLKRNIKDKGIKELLKLQKKEDCFQDRMERNSKVDYVRYEGSADLFTRKIPEVKAMNLDLLTYESSLEDRQKALVERQAASKRKAPDSAGCSPSPGNEPQTKKQKTVQHGPNGNCKTCKEISDEEGYSIDCTTVS